MKKTLLTLGAVAAMSFAFVACGDDTKDCECALTVLGVDTGVKAEVNEFDGDCDEISFDDLDSKTQDGLTAADVELNCEEK
ncbi:MAG: hypothetical protein IJ759_03545 [Bacteroidales bacterium]|nr:hypothetical protein [Bacteroidales bacterium]